MANSGVGKRWMCDEPEHMCLCLRQCVCVRCINSPKECIVLCWVKCVHICIYDLYFCTLSLSAKDISAILVDELRWIGFRLFQLLLFPPTSIVIVVVFLFLNGIINNNNKHYNNSFHCVYKIYMMKMFAERMKVMMRLHESIYIICNVVVVWCGVMRCIVYIFFGDNIATDLIVLFICFFFLLSLLVNDMFKGHK